MLQRVVSVGIVAMSSYVVAVEQSMVHVHYKTIFRSENSPADRVKSTKINYVIVPGSLYNRWSFAIVRLCQIPFRCSNVRKKPSLRQFTARHSLCEEQRLFILKFSIHRIYFDD
jgi:hypothetical protein